MMAASNVTAGSGSPLALSCLVIATNQNRLRFARHWLPTIEPIATPTATPIIRPESLLEQTIIHECAKQPATVSNPCNSIFMAVAALVLTINSLL